MGKLYANQTNRPVDREASPGNLALGLCGGAVMRCGFLAAALAALWAHAARAAPLELYGKLPTIETLALSPDGENIALIATSGEVRRIIVTRLADRKPCWLLRSARPSCGRCSGPATSM